jgi:MarR-like DNA-binding transcriptional regulator SgrR of sgrS sRNA
MLTGKSNEKLRLNPRKDWYRNLEAVTTNGDYAVTFHLKRPQPAFPMLLASGFSPIYPMPVSGDCAACHGPRTRGKRPGFRPRQANSRERRTVRWREMDSNFQFRAKMTTLCDVRDESDRPSAMSSEQFLKI